MGPLPYSVLRTEYSYFIYSIVGSIPFYDSQVQNRSESGDTSLAFVLPWSWRDQARLCPAFLLDVTVSYRTVPGSIHSGYPQSPPTQYQLPYQYRTHTACRSLSLSVSLPPLAHLLLPVFPLFLFLFFFLFFSFLSFLSSPSYHRGFSQLCLDIDRLFPFFWPPQPVFGVLSHGRRQTVRRLWPPESLLRFLAILLYLLLSTLLRLDSIESSSSWCS